VEIELDSGQDLQERVDDGRRVVSIRLVRKTETLNR
jgi:hypothetical protein